MKNNQYRCPLCGQEGVIGEHFCSGKAPASALREEIKLTGKNLYWNPKVTLVVASAMIIGFLWSIMGPRALLAAALIPLILLLGKKLKKKGISRDSNFRELIQLTGQDELLAERLILFELKKTPGLTRKQAILDAISRLKYERSR